MLRKDITFRNLDGEPVTDTFYFHLSKPALARLEMSKKGGLDAWIKTVMESGEQDVILATFEKIISMAYGVRHEDGLQFIQSDALSDAFMQTDAYSELFMELMGNVDAAAQFITHVVPEDMRDRIPSVDDSLSALETETKKILDVPVESLSPQLSVISPPTIDPPKPKSALGVVDNTPAEDDLTKMNEDQLRAMIAKLQK